MMLVLHHIALGLHNFFFGVQSAVFPLAIFFKVKMGILAYVVHPDSQASYPPYFEVAGFRCGIHCSSNGLHSRLSADGSLNSDS